MWTLTVRQSLRAGSLLQWMLIACVAWLIVDTAFVSSSSGDTHPINKSASGSSSQRTELAQGTLDQYAGIWERDLQQVLIKPKVKPKPKVKEPAPKQVALPRLLATFVENGKAWALLVTNKGTQVVRKQGTSIGSFDIVSIASGSVSLRRGDKVYELSVPKPKTSSTRTRRRG